MFGSAKFIGSDHAYGNNTLLGVAVEQVRRTVALKYTAPSAGVLRMYTKQYTTSHSSLKEIKVKNSLVMEKHSFLLNYVCDSRRMKSISGPYFALMVQRYRFHTIRL